MRFLYLWAAIPLAFPLLAGEPQAKQPEEKPGRIFWIIPNHRASPSGPAQRLTWRQKFGIASADATDPGNLPLALIFAAQGQATNSNPPFGQGVAGFSRYFGAALGDQIIGDYLGEGLFPSLLHQDPRYFRRGTGSVLSRIGSAALKLVRTRGDSGRQQFNYSSILGAVTATEISSLYYQSGHRFGPAARGFGIQFGSAFMGNLLTEFWPDIHRKLSRKSH